MPLSLAAEGSAPRLEHSLLHCAERIRIELFSMRLDRRPHWTRMRREIEEAQVDVSRIEVELPAHGIPILQILRCRGLCGEGFDRGERSGSERTGDEETSSAIRHDRLLCESRSYPL